jgi:hypothetical protein
MVSVNIEGGEANTLYLLKRKGDSNSCARLGVYYQCDIKNIIGLELSEIQLIDMAPTGFPVVFKGFR